MKQRTPMPNPVDLGTQLKSDDFLTGEDMQDPPLIPPDNQSQTDDIPDLHKTEGIPGANRRSAIAKEVDIKMNRLQTLDEKIQEDVVSAQKQKLEGMPQSPKDILKSLIAQGEYKETVKLWGQEWTIRALDQGDVLMSLDEIRDTLITQSGRLMAMMFGTLIYALEAINGISVYEWFDEIKLSDYGNNRMEYAVAVRRALRKYLEAMPPSLIDSLYDKYTEIDTRRNEAFGKLKNS